MAKRRGANGAVARAAVIGHPVSHSLSPEIFATISRATGVDLAYDRRDVSPADLRAFLRAAGDERGLVGWNVTIPHKQAVARRCDRLSAEARAIGAVNVVRFGAAGRIEGHNTDALGVERTLAEAGFRTRGATAIVLGAGGAALAAGFALGRGRAAEVVFANRTPARARAVARRLARLFPRTRFRGVGLDGKLPGQPGLCINATPVGMAGFPAESLLPPGLGPGTLAFDMVYRPLETPFLAEARRRGCATVGGLDMLTWQALGTYRIWFKRRGLAATDERALQRTLKRRLARRLRAEEVS